MKFARNLTVCAVLALVPAGAMVGGAALHAQADNGARSLTGAVTDKAGNKVKGAVVHLKDTRSLAQRSYITPDDGSFRFAQVSGGSDFEVWADLNGKRTPRKSISSFDTKKSIEMTLKLPD